MPVSAEHMALLETGEVLVYQGGPDAHLRDTATGETEAVPTPHEAAPNCAGLATLADGRLLTVSGDEEGGPAEVVERLVPGSVDGWPTSGPRRARDGLLPGLHLLPAATSCGPV
jgi:hypothetical protein